MTVTRNNRLNKNKTVKRRNKLSTSSSGKYVYGGADSQIYVAGSSERKFGGRGLLTDIAVPALLLYANNTIGKRKLSKSKKSGKSTKNKVRFSRKYK
jgi:hypothetical protein